MFAIKFPVFQLIGQNHKFLVILLKVFGDEFEWVLIFWVFLPVFHPYCHMNQAMLRSVAPGSNYTHSLNWIDLHIMKKIGVIGGLSWVSTAEYYRLLNGITQEKLGGVNSARLSIESVNRQKYVQHVIEEKNELAAGEMICHAAQCLERAGADFIVISCNDVHRFVSRIEPEISIPILHIAEATAAVIKQAGIHTVGLLGVRKTMEENFYSEVLRHHGINTIIPNADERTYIHDSIYEELVKNVFLDATREKYIEIINGLQSRGAEGIVLGCTEIPLLVSAGDVQVKTFSTTAIHCKAAIEMALG
ncbi:MAG: aspartate/glutamate racemase family protein [Gammaproteobacteria bacterium]|nr:aspartate/glutamate racemase family protein [Gammaproteobacteria bacterium]